MRPLWSAKALAERPSSRRTTQTARQTSRKPCTRNDLHAHSRRRQRTGCGINASHTGNRQTGAYRFHVVVIAGLSLMHSMQNNVADLLLASGARPRVPCCTPPRQCACCAGARSSGELPQVWLIKGASSPPIDVGVGASGCIQFFLRFVSRPDAYGEKQGMHVSTRDAVTPPSLEVRQLRAPPPKTQH